LGFPIETKWCSDQDVKVVPGATRAAESVEIRKELTGKSYMLARNQSAASQVKSNNMPRIAKKKHKTDCTNFLAWSRWSNTWPCDATVTPT